MLIRLLKADFLRGKSVAGTLIALITLAATLAAGSTTLIINTLAATTQLGTNAKVPDIIQMHTGDIDSDTIEQWAHSRSDITAHEIISTLRVPRHELSIAGVKQSSSYSEPAFVRSSTSIDFLLDEAGAPAQPGPGEIYLPIHYHIIGAASVGDTVQVNNANWSIEFTVVGFIRDAQMNAAMVPSKRLLISEKDYAFLSTHISDVEHLIEFTTAPGASDGAIISAYKEAGLPSTGLSITSSQLALMNSLSSMLIAAVALLVAGILTLVAILALRYTILAAIESDLAQIAVLKAIGAPHKGISRLYRAKYLVLALTGSIIGYALGYPLAEMLGAPTVAYMGKAPFSLWTILLPLLMVAGLSATIILFTTATLRRIGKISAITALRNGTASSLRQRRLGWRLSHSRILKVPHWLGLREAFRSANILLTSVLALCTFTIAVPSNVASTLGNPELATYLGVGDADLRIDIPLGSANLSEVSSALEADPRITTHTAILRRDYSMLTQEGQWESLLIDSGDASAFAMKYLSGSAPTNDQEIAVSYAQAEVVKAQVGSNVSVQTPTGQRNLKVTGIYQDITNNGLTAKVTFEDDAPVLWQLMYANTDSPEAAAAIAQDLRKAFPGIQVTPMSEYATQFFGATGSQVHIIALLAGAVALALTFLITILFALLVLARENPAIRIQHALGATVATLRRQYVTRFAAIGIIGTAIGVVATSTLGQSAIGAVMATRGAPGLELLPNPYILFLAIPAAVLFTVSSALFAALSRLTSRN
ncbi:MAG: ABC transporter permease [Actinomycetaceae bacterium]|nr:ABC transporter permease [Actinomycetaceae bacterium]